MTRHTHVHTIKFNTKDEELLKQVAESCGETTSECIRSALKIKAVMLKTMKWPDVLLKVFDIFEANKKENSTIQ